MDCDYARLLLLFDRTGPNPDLAADDAASLEAHLATCPACLAAATTSRRVDAAIARPFRGTTVPSALRGDLLARADAGLRREWRSRWSYRAVAAAAALAVGWLSWGGYVAATRPTLDTWTLGSATEATVEKPEAAARAWMAQEGLGETLPEEFDFRQLAGYGYGELQGVRVPTLEFRNGANFAKVILLKPGSFSTRGATDAQNSTVTVRLYRDRPAAGWVVLVVYTGTSLQPFLRAVPGQV